MDTKIGNTAQISFNQDRSTQIGTSQIGTSQNTVVQVGTPKVGIFKIRESQSTHYQASTKKISPRQVASTQFDPFHVTIGVQIDPSKVALPSSISSQQFFRSHLPNHDLTSILNAKTRDVINAKARDHITFKSSLLAKKTLTEEKYHP